MWRPTSLEVLGLYVLSIVACSAAREPTPHGVGDTAGKPALPVIVEGGSFGRTPPAAASGNAAPTPKQPAADDSSDGGPAPDTTAGGLCTGTANGGFQGGAPGNAQVPRSVGVACYAAPVTAGRLNCLPASDSTVVGRLGPYSIQSCGFVAEFVIEAAADDVVPASCDPLLDCCQAKPAAGPMSCQNTVDRLQLVHPDYRGGFCTSSTKQVCGDASVVSVDESDGGAEANSQRYGLCCYRTCGHSYCI